jgi:hypothetical protein
MTVRDAILLSIPVFGAHGRSGPAAVRAELIAAGIPAPLAAEVVEFLPLALARAMLEGMGIRFADHYVRQTAQGRVVGQKLLTDEPVFREGLAIAGEISGGGTDEFMAVAGLSPEYRAIHKLLSSGSQPEDLQCAPPVVLANDEDRRAFDDTSGGVQPKQKKPWWQFWK